MNWSSKSQTQEQACNRPLEFSDNDVLETITWMFHKVHLQKMSGQIQYLPFSSDFNEQYTNKY